MLTDVKGSGIDAQMSTEAHAGSNVTLSIDERIQFVAERELKAAVLKNRARTGSLIVMNPYTGEILAMANYPAFDPNEPPTVRRAAFRSPQPGDLRPRSSLDRSSRW